MYLIDTPPGSDPRIIEQISLGSSSTKQERYNQSIQKYINANTNFRTNRPATIFQAVNPFLLEN